MRKKLPVVANTSPLIALSVALADFSVLSAVAERVFVPAEVLAELRAGDRADATHHLVRAAACCEVLEPFAALPVLLTSELGRGEAAVIHAALTRGVSIVAIDELRGRRWARRHGLRVTGSLGLLLELYHAGEVPSLEAAFAAMKAKGIYLDDRLLQQVLAAARSERA